MRQRPEEPGHRPTFRWMHSPWDGARVACVTHFTSPRYVWDRRHDVHIVDVRERWEFEQDAIEGAVHTPLGEVMNGEVVATDKPVILVCATGEKSELAALMLQMRGLEAYNIDGGMDAWEREGLPTSASGSSGRASQAN